ncbi:tape measure protein [Agrobacterium vitis]
MAISEERLVAVLEARIADYEKNLAKALRTTNSSFTRIETRGKQMEAKLAAIGRGAGDGFSRALATALGGLSAVLSVGEVAKYADAWTKAKNSLAVASVTGERQRVILDELFNSAQKNSAPIGALADLYGRAAQSADILGASQKDLVKFSDAVALGLKVGGTSATEASGALQQLGQALGSGNVQAEEFNSIMDGTPAIAKAAAAGIKEANGSVAKLKQLVNDGKISSQNLFQGILAGAQRLEEMAGNTTQTIEQATTRINNAFTKYIGQTDESLSGSQRLVAGLNALADNFDSTADTAVQLGTVLGAALVGRGIGSMIGQVPRLVSAVGLLVTAFRTGAGVAAAFGGVLGPLGLLVGVAAGAAVAFGAFSNSVDDATRSLAEQAASSSSVKGMLEDTKRAQEAYKQAIANTAGVQSKSTDSIVASTKREFEAKKSLLELELKRQRALLAVQEVELQSKAAQLKSEIGSQVYTRNSSVQQGYSDPKVGDFVRLPDSITGLEKTQAAIDSNPLTNEIKRIRAESDLTAVSVDQLSTALNSSFADGPGGGAVSGAVSANGTGGNKKGGGAKAKADEYQKMRERIEEATAATQAETAAQGQLNPTIDDFGFAAAKARAQFELLNAAKEAGLTVTPELEKQIEQLSTAYANAGVQAEKLAQSQDKAREAAQQLKSDAKDILSGVVSDLRDGASAAEVFGNAINKLADKMIDSLLDSILQINSAGGSGGFLDSLFKGLGNLFGGSSGNSITSSSFKTNTTLGSFLGLKDGGDVEPQGLIRGPGGPRGDKIPTALSDGEFVVNAAATKRNRALLEAINSRKGFLHRANGGIVSNRSGVLSQPPRSLDVASVAASKAATTQINYSPVIDARGADAEAVSRLQNAIAQDRKTLPTQIINAVRDARARGVKI